VPLGGTRALTIPVSRVACGGLVVSAFAVLPLLKDGS
jgi:hypothetical protein